MSNKRLGLNVYAKIVPQKPVNEQFTLCKCYVMYTGKNANYSEISKEAVEDALPTLSNIPVVGHLYQDEDGNYFMGGHDYNLEVDENGELHWKRLTVPFGVVPENNNAHFEEIEERGETKNYLVADIILWTGRYPELFNAIYDEKTYFSQSMEIVAKQTEQQDEYTKINKFLFSALCMLGKSDDESKDVKPCFESAKIEPYEFSDSNAEWTKMFEEFKEELKKCFAEKQNFEEGGAVMGEDKPIEDQGGVFYLNGLENEPTVEETPEAVPDETNGLEELPPDFVEPTVEEESEEFGMRQKMEKLSAALNRDEWLLEATDEYVYYEKYFFEDEDNRELVDKKIFRASYTEDKDGKFIIDRENEVEVFLTYLTAEQMAQIEADKAEFERLRKYEQDRKEADKKAEYAKILEDFSDMAEFDEYKEIVKDAMAFETAEALTEKLYAVRGKNMKKQTKKSLASVVFPIDKNFGEENEKEKRIDEFMKKHLSE